ncbi:MAG: FAD-dependent thymidylate synthase [archaeon]
MNDLTKRLTVAAAEDALFTEYRTHTSGFVKLIDYMGGDALIERVATAGYGRDIFPEHPSSQEFFAHLQAKAIRTPFQSTQLKFHIQSSIEDALEMVYERTGSVNEYSGRYSLLLKTAHVPKNLLPHIASIKKIQDDTYEWFVSEDVDLARELARLPVGTMNDTMFFWKMDLYNLTSFIKQKRAQGKIPVYLQHFEHLARRVAPEATAALLSEGKNMMLTYPEDSIIDAPLRPAAWSAQQTRRQVVPALENVLYLPQQYLDKGAIQAVEYLGSDVGPAEAARMSYGRGTKKASDDKNLIRYLYRHRHTSPFEHNELAVESKTPLFVDPRQAGRHRTLEYCCFMEKQFVGRDYYVPAEEQLRKQSMTNRQGRDRGLDNALPVQERLQDSCEQTLAIVDALRKERKSEDELRKLKGVAFYTYNYRTGDMKNWLHFLSLRLDSHAQWEIQEYARAVEGVMQQFSPLIMDAFREYGRESVHFTDTELRMFLDLEHGRDVDAVKKAYGMVNDRGKVSIDWIEFMQKYQAWSDRNA